MFSVNGLLSSLLAAQFLSFHQAGAIEGMWTFANTAKLSMHILRMLLEYTYERP